MCCEKGHGGSAGSAVFMLLGAVAGLVVLLAKVAGPVLLVAAVLAWRWFTGAPMWGRTAVLAGWPRWQRALARLAVTVPVVAAFWWPWHVATVAASTGAVVCVAALESRRRVAAAAKPIRVVASVRKPAGAVEGAAPAGAVYVGDVLDREVAR